MHSTVIRLIHLTLIIQGTYALYFTQTHYNVTVPYDTPTQTPVTRLFALTEPGELLTNRPYTVDRITIQGPLELSSYFTIDDEGWLYLAQGLVHGLVGTVFNASVSSHATKGNLKASTQIFVRVEVISNKENICVASQLCFTSDDKGNSPALYYEVQESPPRVGDTVSNIGLLNAPHLRRKCREKDVTYTIRLKGQASSHVGLLSVDNTTSVLSVNRRLDRESLSFITADVTCHVVTSSYYAYASTPQLATREIVVQVLDIDDHGPYIMSLNKTTSRPFASRTTLVEPENIEKLCNRQLVIVDDDNGTDQYVVRLEGDTFHAFRTGPLSVNHVKGRKYINTVLLCEHVSRVRNAGLYEFSVVFDDRSLHTSQNESSTARYIIRYNSGYGGIDEAPKCTTTSLPSTTKAGPVKYDMSIEVTVTSSAARYSRVTNQIFVYSILCWLAWIC